MTEHSLLHFIFTEIKNEFPTKILIGIVDYPRPVIPFQLE